MGLFDTLKNITTKAGGQHEIDDFKAMVGKRGGLARTNRFVVIMTPPDSSFLNTDWEGLASQALAGNLGFNDLVNDPRDIAMLCESCSFPGRQLNSIEYELDGFRNQIKVPYTYSNEDITMTFHLTNDYYIKKVMDKWIGSVIDEKNHSLHYRNEYSKDLIIQQLNQKNQPIYGLKFENAFPLSINSVELSNASSDTTQKVQVTFTYDSYKPEGGIASMVSGTSGLLGGIANFGTDKLVSGVKKLF
jgi:hypothetical protein